MMFFLLFPFISYATVTTDSFIIQINNRSIEVISPAKKNIKFAVIVENKSLTKQIGKFVSQNKNLKYITVLPGKSETVELINKGDEIVNFIPLSPAFQDVSLEFGKKTYEVPAKN